MNMKRHVEKIAHEAKTASFLVSRLSSKVKNHILSEMANRIEASADDIISENSKDIAYAEEKGLSSALVDRLKLDSGRIKEMSECLRDVVALPDPIGEVISMWKRPNGLQIGRMRVPLGVVGVIYESRPNVTVDVAGLCLKAGNCVILRGGSEAYHSNMCLGNLMRRVLKEEGIPSAAISLIDITDRSAVNIMLKLDNYLDVIIPRGGEGLIRTVVENSTIPVIKHYKGVCHTFVDASADVEMALNISFNAKTQRPGTCNAMETLLVHKEVAQGFLPPMVEMFAQAGVQLRGCERCRAIAPTMDVATEDDWYKEYLDLILAVRIVDSVDDAVDHINQYGSCHSDAIITRDYSNARKFLEDIDSAAVYVNASTRFTDGNQFGLGAEIGISTQKLHARGPMGLEELTCTKFIIYGSGQIRE